MYRIVLRWRATLITYQSYSEHYTSICTKGTTARNVKHFTELLRVLQIYVRVILVLFQFSGRSGVNLAVFVDYR